MDRSIREHISALEQRIERLSEEVMNSPELEERNRIEAEIEAATFALSLLRHCLARKRGRGQHQPALRSNPS
jgi:hypothetical protein